MDPLAGYPADVGRELRRVLGAGPAQLLAATAEEYRSRGVTVATWSDGRQEIRPVVLDPLPRVVPAAEWAAARGRRRAAPPRAQRLPRRRLPGGRTAARRRRPVARRSCGRRRCPSGRSRTAPAATPTPSGWPGRGSRGRPLAAADLVAHRAGGVDGGGRPPAGARRPRLRAGRPRRRSARSCPASSRPPGVLDPRRRGSAARRGAGRRGAARRHGRPADRRPHAPGTSDDAWFEHRLLADALGVPLVRATDLWPRLDGGAGGGRRRAAAARSTCSTAGSTTPCCGAYRTPTGQPLDVLLTEAVRAGPARAGQRARATASPTTRRPTPGCRR